MSETTAAPAVAGASQPGQLVVVPDYRAELRAIACATGTQSGVQDSDVIKEAVKYLGSKRIPQAQRVQVLNDARVHSGEPWTDVGLKKFAAVAGIRMAPLGDVLFGQFQARRDEEQRFLQLVLEQVRQGKISYREIREGLAAQYGGSLSAQYGGSLSAAPEGESVPSALTIARVLKFCRNDSSKLAAEIDQAFREGNARRPPAANSLRAFLLRTEQNKLAAQQP